MEEVQLVKDAQLSEANREALQSVADAVLASCKCVEPMHYMIAGTNVSDARLPSDCSKLDSLRELASDLAAKVAPGMDVISVRLLFSPPGAPAQPFHLDYARHFSQVKTIFVAVSPATASNCTEFLNLGSRNAELVSRAREATESGLPACDVEEFKRHSCVEQIVLDRWQVCMVNTVNVFHRRGANRSDFIRIAFNIDCAHLSDSPDFVDVDMKRSLAQERVCGLDVVDDLDEQDVSLGSLGIIDVPASHGDSP